MRAVLTPAASLLAAGLVGAALLSACGGSRETQPVPGGDSARGAAIIEAYGCGACHVIPGIDGANGRVGPDLTSFSSNRYLAGQLPNTVDNAVRWITDPHAINPDTVMPDLGLTENQASDVAAYLYGH